MTNNNLQSQIYLYSISTDGFHNEDEHIIHTELMKFYGYRNILKNRKGVDKRKEFIGDHINVKKKELNVLLNQNKDTRELREDALIDTNKISQFESTLTRTLGIEEKETTTDIMMVRAYHYTVFESLIKNGFVNADGERYQYLTSSAGMIRNKKSVFIKSQVADSVVFNEKVWCGLNVDKINDTKFTSTDNEGNEVVEYGINVNKYNAYLALCMTSSVPVANFNIDQAIVVKDFKTVLMGREVDYIDNKGNITPNFKKDIEINHIDGAGMCLPNVSEKSFQFRMPHFKGLMIPFEFDKFITKVAKKDDVTVTDIYGTDWNIIENDIRYIFTESQFKLAKYYSDWNEYKDAFKKGCELVICKEESSVFNDKPINYQALQTLTRMTTDELRQLASQTNKDIATVGSDKEIMMRILGAYSDHKNKDNFQQALEIYPELLNDQYSKEAIRATRDSLYKDAKAGKLLLEGSKRTFIAPDLFAFSERLFMGIENPNGLLNDGEVSCKLYGRERVDALRSPHLFREHCVRDNIRNAKTNKWFITKCVYTSVNDLISKQLMFDVDGDECHLISNPLFVEIADRNMEGILPLEYTLATAKKEKVTGESIYNSLVAAYSKNIGEVSNSISKIWSSDKVDLDAIRQLCYLNNGIIDFAKTLWLPKFSDEVNATIKKLTSGKLPFFFTYAKDKKLDQIVRIPDINKIEDEIEREEVLEKLSTVNKLEYIIKKKRIYFSKIENDFDYRFLMNKKKVVKTDQAIIDKYNELNRRKKSQLNKQLKLQDITRSITHLAVYVKIKEVLLEINPNEDEVVDMLVEYLYTKKPDSKKTTLWKSFGHVILRNLEANLEEAGQCEDCDTRFRKVNKNKVTCDFCKKKRGKKDATKRKRKHREKQNCDTK